MTHSPHPITVHDAKRRAQVAVTLTGRSTIATLIAVGPMTKNDQGANGLKWAKVRLASGAHLNVPIFAVAPVEP